MVSITSRPSRIKKHRDLDDERPDGVVGTLFQHGLHGSATAARQSQAVSSNVDATRCDYPGRHRRRKVCGTQFDTSVPASTERTHDRLPTEQRRAGDMRRRKREVVFAARFDQNAHSDALVAIESLSL